MNYYTVATNKEGQSFVLESDYYNYVEAKADLAEQCKRTGLQFNGIRPYANKKKGDSTLTKNILRQKREGTLKQVWF